MQFSLAPAAWASETKSGRVQGQILLYSELHLDTSSLTAFMWVSHSPSISNFIVPVPSLPSCAATATLSFSSLPYAKGSWWSCPRRPARDGVSMDPCLSIKAINAFQLSLMMGFLTEAVLERSLRDRISPFHYWALVSMRGLSQNLKMLVSYHVP